MSAPVTTEEIVIGNRTFYKSTFMGVTVIKTDDGFYNATKIAQDNGYVSFAQISRNDWWKDYYKTVKKFGIYDEKRRP